MIGKHGQKDLNQSRKFSHGTPFDRAGISEMTGIE